MEKMANCSKKKLIRIEKKKCINHSFEVSTFTQPLTSNGQVNGTVNGMN